MRNTSANSSHLLDISSVTHHDTKDEWVFWYLVPEMTQAKNDQNWSSFLKQLTEFHSIEDFWLIFNSVRPISTLPPGCRYYVFRKEDEAHRKIQPLWEDPSISGGYEIYNELAIEIAPAQRGKHFQQFLTEADEKTHKIAEEYWIDLVLSVLGIQIKHYDKIIGMEYNHRKNKTDLNKSILKIGVWTSPLSDDELQEIKENLKEIFNLQSQAAEKDILIKKISTENPV